MVANANINILSGGQKARLLAIQQTERSINETQLSLASGKAVNSAIDNPQNFFLSTSLDNRASDLFRVLEGVGQGIRTVQTADAGIEAIQKLLDQAESLIDIAEIDLYSGGPEFPEPNVLPDDIAEVITYNTGQNIGGTFELREDENGKGLFLDGNLWKRVAIDYEITQFTKLRFDYTSTNQPEISAIGFDNNTAWTDNPNHFFVYGEQTNGVPYAAPTGTFEYTDIGNVETIVIPVGEYFTGDFPFLHFIHDDDGAGDDGDAFWQNVTLFEGNNDLFEDSSLAKAARYEAQYQDIMSQIDRIVQDANYRGINLLAEDDLTTNFNEKRTSTLVTDGVDASALGLGLAERDFKAQSRVISARGEVRDARSSLREYSRALSSNLNVIKTRRDYTHEVVNILKAGSNDLVLADQNKLGAEFLSLQVRQQIQFETLTLSERSIADFI